MIVLWQNGRTHSDAEIVFVEVPPELVNELLAVLERGARESPWRPHVMGVAERIAWRVQEATSTLPDFAFACGRSTEDHAAGCPVEGCTCWIGELEKLAARAPARCCAHEHQTDTGVCATFERGTNGRCVYCDHEEKCHPGPGST